MTILRKCVIRVIFDRIKRENYKEIQDRLLRDVEILQQPYSFYCHLCPLAVFEKGEKDLMLFFICNKCIYFWLGRTSRNEFISQECVD